MPDLDKAAGVIEQALRRAREIVHSDAGADTAAFEAGYVFAALSDAGLLLPEGFVAVRATATDSELKAFGWAPGNYMNKCPVCDMVHENCDKRALICRPCAEREYRAMIQAQTDGAKALQDGRDG